MTNNKGDESAVIKEGSRPNVIFVFSDQHRAQATGYAGDANALTPNLDRLASECIRFSTAVSCIPVCSPNRATLLTGQYPLTHGLFINDIPIGSEHVSVGEAFAAAGYDTAYIGKWHVDGHGRESFIPPERRKGFRFWRVLECTHSYNRSCYYGDSDDLLQWEDYDAEAQTRCAIDYIRERCREQQPFFLALSWGPPHDPYHTAPQRFRDMTDGMPIKLRPNVPEEAQEQTERDLRGYYAHLAALDEYLGMMLKTLREEGADHDTIFVYTSDHGDMLGSHSFRHKQYPYDESILVPLLIRYPAQFGPDGRTIDVPINSPDIMPTLLGLAGADIPSTVEGNDYSPALRGEQPFPAEAALIEIIHPFGQLPRRRGGKEYRGIRTARHTYVKDLNGPWLLFDNVNDPYQMNNLVGQETCVALEQQLDKLLLSLLKERGDEFLPSEAYTRQWGYETDPATGKVLGT